MSKGYLEGVALQANLLRGDHRQEDEFEITVRRAKFALPFL
jgi:hypothetical protein